VEDHWIGHPLTRKHSHQKKAIKYKTSLWRIIGLGPLWFRNILIYKKLLVCKVLVASNGGSQDLVPKLGLTTLRSYESRQHLIHHINLSSHSFLRQTLEQLGWFIWTYWLVWIVFIVSFSPGYLLLEHLANMVIVMAWAQDLSGIAS
jgi:hypothetical protein